MQTPSATAQIHSVNVSGPLRSVPFAGHSITTGIFKTAVRGTMHATKSGIAGDAQADLSVHGGPEKAVYFYPQEHYAAWEKLLGSGPLPPGSFGENITSHGLLETDLSVGDVLQIGTATLQVLQPRSPCYKLQIRFGRPDMTALFFHEAKPGWYASVLQEGTFAAGEEIVLIDRARESLTIAEVWRYSAQGQPNRTILERVRQLQHLPDFWRDRISRNALP